MTIKYTFDKSMGLYIPFHENGGVHTEFCNYLICRKFYPQRFKTPKKPVEPQTIRLYYYRIKLLLDLFEENEVSFTEATYEYHIESFKTFFREEWDWKEESLYLYISTWRDFYNFLTIDGVLHNMHFPVKIVGSRKVDSEDDMLNYTKDSHIKEYSQETAVDQKRMTYKDDYSQDVFSMNEYWQLYNTLYEDDPVYAVMTSTMLQTFLRIGGISQFPLAPNSLNPKWLRYKQMKNANKVFQNLKYIKKGGSEASLIVHIHTMNIIDEFYLKPCYSEREALFKTKYCNSKHARKKGITINNKYLWLNKHGTPVSDGMLQDAFREAGEKLGFHAHPHMCRHTGTTQLLWRYCKEKNIKIHEGMAPDIHSWLKSQCGHSLLSTTKYYVNTVYRLEANNVVMNMLPGQMEDLETSMSSDVKESYNKALKEHELYFKGRLA
jgi:site-specific recombinase XerC